MPALSGRCVMPRQPVIVGLPAPEVDYTEGPDQDWVLVARALGGDPNAARALSRTDRVAAVRHAVRIQPRPPSAIALALHVNQRVVLQIMEEIQ